MDEQLEGEGTGEDSTKHGVVLPEEEAVGIFMLAQISRCSHGSSVGLLRAWKASYL